MSDIVLGALIGLGGALLGTIIAGIINYYNSRLQIKARLDELNQQQTYNERQARIERQINLRTNTLVPLKEVISKWIDIQNHSLVMTIRLKTVYERKGNPKEKAEEMALWTESGKKVAQITSELAVLQGQISDSSLAQLIETAIEEYWETQMDATRLLVTINNPKESDTRTMLNTIKEYRAIQNKLRSNLLEVNKRIDDLLLGDT